MARNTGKSVIKGAYMLWRALYIENFSWLILSNSADNAKKLHFLPLVELLISWKHAEYIRWLFQHRIPEGLAGSNSEQLIFHRTDPLAGPAISYAGIDSKLEGIHPNGVVLDDPEGADADKGGVINELSYQAWQRIIPLLRHPTHSQMLLVGTPWGPNPIVYRLRDQVGWTSERDNATSPIKFFWRPIVNERGESIWPQKFPTWKLDELRTDPIFDTQFLLKRQSDNLQLFDVEKIRKNTYSWLGPEQTQLFYQGFEVDREKVTEEGYVIPERKEAIVSLRDLRTFLHFDPLHRTAENRKWGMAKQRPAEAAIVVVGVAPDFHAFVLEYWHKDADLEIQARELYRLYLKWEPHKVTFEGVGAQFWLVKYIESQEKSSEFWGLPRSSGRFGPPLRLPRLSTRMEEAGNKIVAKERVMKEALSPWFTSGALHLRDDQDEAFTQLEEAMNERSKVDIIDALSQGPPVWTAPIADARRRGFAERRAYLASVTGNQPEAWKRMTGYQGPSWGRR